MHQRHDRFGVGPPGIVPAMRGMRMPSIPVNDVSLLTNNK